MGVVDDNRAGLKASIASIELAAMEFGLLQLLVGPTGPVLLAYNETRRTDTSWRPLG